MVNYVVTLNIWEKCMHACAHATAIRSYANVSRDINFINITTSTQDTNTTQIMYWDKATGILHAYIVVIRYTLVTHA